MKKLIIVLMFLVSMQTVSATAESWRTCYLDEPCMLGDHVYNDTWQPYTERICTVNITYPNGTRAVIDGSMDNNTLGTGFHNYSYTPTAGGFYAVEMYCTNGIDSGRIDRSFMVKEAITRGGEGMIWQIYLVLLVVGLGLMFITLFTPRHEKVVVPVLSGIFLFATAFYSYEITQAVGGGITYEYIYPPLALFWGGLGFLMFGMALWKATAELPEIIER